MFNNNPPIRRSVSDEQKLFVLLRDNFTCRYCGNSPLIFSAHMDHAIPVSKGGSTTSANLRTSCQRCNLEKGEKTEMEYFLWKCYRP